MATTSTRPFALLFSTALLWFLQLLSLPNLYAQANNATPTFNVDLSGDPNGIWASGEITRNGQLCNADKNDNCVQFNITLNQNSGGLQFIILSGPTPSGSMGYQIDCGPQTPVGQPICVSGPGPHKLSLCMPGGAKGSYEIRSVPAFNPVDDAAVTQGCSSMLQAPTAFKAETITWRDVSGNGYEKYLSFPNGKATPVITPDASAPAYVDYEVCGASQTSECATLPYCDVMRVYFYPPPVVTIGPDPAIICPGSSGVVLMGYVTGGDGEFEYIWTDSNGNVQANTPNYTATAIGLYTLEVRTKNYPNCQKFSASVNVVTNLTVNAGPDQLVCSSGTAQLAGAVTAATGGIWSGGSGSFSDRTALNTVYTPSAADLSAGSVKLTLTSTGNGSCTAVKDEVLISFYTMNVSLTGTLVICNGTLGSISTNVIGGQGTVKYLWSSGETTAAISNKPAGNYTVTVSDGKGCAITKPFTITEVTGPSDLAATLKPSTCGNSNGELNVTGVTNGMAPYTYSKDNINFQAASTFKGIAAGNYTITVRDANGCTITKAYSLTNAAGPTAVAATTQQASCKNNDGRVLVGVVNGGTAPYTYTVDGISFQTSNTFTGLASGTYTITARDANNCSVTTSVSITRDIPTNFTSSATASTCGSNNGELTVIGVTGGFAPYTYSKDGKAFQNTATFSALVAGSYTITVKDDRGCTISKQVQIANIAGPTGLTATAQPTTCGNANGQVAVSAVAGGTAPYTYSKDGVNFQATGTFQNLLAGTYSISAKDANGCVYSEQATVTDIAGPTFTATAKNSTCGNSNGQIVVSGLTGGTAPFSYSKDGSIFQSGTTFAALAVGDYTITIKDKNGCLATRDVTVSNIAGPSDVALTSISSTCGANNGKLEVAGVTGGTAPYSYSINGTNFQSSTTFRSVLAGEYTVTVKDSNGCSISKKVTVDDQAAPTNLTAGLTSSTCGSGNGELTLTGVTGGTAPYAYSIDGVNFQAAATFTALSAGQHAITVKDANGCTFIKSFTITNIAGPTAATASSVPATCADNDGSITAGTVTGGTAPYIYSVDGSNFKAEKVFGGLASGSYTLTVKDAKGCTVTKPVTVGKNIPTAFTSTINSSTCGDSNGHFTISSVTGGVAPYAYSIDGTNFHSSSTFTALAAGTYQVRVKDANGCVYTGSVQVSNIAGPAFTAAARANTCGSSNGSISISNVSGGTAPYTYSKDGTSFQASTTFNGLLAGAYTIITKDANGCISSAVVKVQDIAGPTSVELATAATTCGNPNGSITVGAVTGGTAPYLYSINGSATFQSAATFATIAAGEHTITVKDANGCTLIREVTVADIAGPADLMLTSTASTCGASNGKLEVSGVDGGTAPYMFSLDGAPFQSATAFANVAAGQYAVTVRDASGCTFVKNITLSNMAGPTALAATSLPATCADNDGSITAGTVTGGTAPYIYSIDGSNFKTIALFEALASGSYTLTAKDANGCTVTTSVTVGKNIPTSFASTTVPSACGSNDGQLTITGVTGGKAPYLYSMDGSVFQTNSTFTTLTAGAYTITLKDANGCTVSKQVQVNDKGGPTNLMATATATTCGNSNGSINISSVTGGTAPYIYSLDGANFQAAATFAALAAGTYQVSVKDANGCLYTEELVVTDLAAPTFTATPQAATCGNSNGGITITNITGGTTPFQFSRDGVTFQAGTTFNGLAAGAYTITAKDANSCLRTVAVALENIPGPTDFTLATTASTCGSSNGSIAASAVRGGTAPYTYSIDGTSFQSATAFEAIRAGEYTVTVKDANGCSISKQITVDDVAGPANLAASLNPTTCGASNGALTVTGVTGGTAPYLYSSDGVNFQASETFSGLAAGQYAITVKDTNGCTFVKNFTLVDIAGPAAIASSTRPATCADNDGSISISGVPGGTAPYLYTINGSSFQGAATFPALASGTYTITVKDANGCTVSKEVAVAKNVTTSFASTTVSSTCGNSNGQFTISNIKGGTAPYTYSIGGTTYQSDATFTALAAGVYKVSVKDANGCVFMDEVQLNDASGPAFTAMAQASTCGSPNGQVTVSAVTGGTAPFIYSVDGGDFQATATFGNLLAGTHYITTKDANGCSTIKAVEVGDIAGPSNLDIQTVSSTCGNSTGQISISGVTDGTAPYSYSINGTSFQSTTTFAALAAGEYTVTVKDANGCTFAQKAVVENINGPTGFTASTIASVCGNPSGELTVGEVSGGVASYTYSKDGTIFQTSTSFTGLAAGNHTIRVKDANGCTFIKTFTITNIAGPAAVAATAQPATCADNDGMITVGNVTGGTAPYLYSISGRGFQTEALFTAVTSGSYTLTVRDANGCTATTSVVVTKKTPAAFTSTTVSSTCGSDNGALTITGVTGGSAPYLYSINGTTFQSSATFTALTAGSYTITVKDTNGCTYAAQVQVSNVAGPSDLAATAKPTTCGDSNGQLTVSGVTGGTAPYSYSINGGSFQSSGAFSALASGSYTISVKDARGCVYTEEVEVTNIAGPVFTVAAKASTCGNSNGSVTAGTVSGGTAPFFYSKDGVTFQSEAVFSALAAGDYTIIIKDGNGCTFTETVAVTNIAGPTDLALTSTSSTCGNSNGQIKVGTVTGGTAPYTYAINGTNFQGSTTFENVLAGEHTITVKDANGCITSKKIVVTNVAGPSDLAATPKPTTCGASNGELTLTGVTGGTAPYAYSIDMVNFQTATTFTALSAGNHTLTVRDANGCTIGKNFTITNIAGPTAATATSLPATCADNDGSITAGTVTGGTAPYLYSVDGSNFKAENVFSGLASGSYTLTVKDAYGCTVTTSVTVGKNVPTAFTSTTAYSTCGSSNGALTITGVTGGKAPYTYSKDGTTFQSTATFAALLAGSHTITIKDANGCTFESQVQVNYMPGPSDLIASIKASTCGDSNGEISITSVQNGAAPYLYALDGTNFQSAATFAALAAGEYRVRIKDANGCVYAEKVQLENASGPTFTAAAQASTCGSSNGTITISSVTGGAAPYTYSKDGASYQASAIFSNLASGIHNVSTKDANGCLRTVAVVVENITGPTAFEVASAAATCGGGNGSITFDNVTGGTAPYRYAINNTDFQSTPAFEAVAAGTYTATAKDANGCIVTKEVVIGNIAGITDFRTSASPSACSANTGSLTVNAVNGGTAPYMYSLDGASYQGSATFTALAPKAYMVYVKDANGCSTSATLTIGTNAPTEATLAATLAGCATSNGTITVATVTGGTEPYAYSIDGKTYQAAAQFGNLAVGNYTITIRDAAGCTLTRTAAVGSTGGVKSFTLTTTDAGCGAANGRLTISNVSGGKSPYSYSINGGNTPFNGTPFQISASFANLSKGNYNVTVKDAEECVYVQQATINGAEPLANPQVKVTPAGCGQSSGQVLVQSMAGGTAPYTYSLNGVGFQASTTFTGVAPGKYTLTVKDAGNCSITAQVVVETVSSKLARVQEESCFGASDGEIAIAATGVTDQTEYSIDNGVSFHKKAVFSNLPQGIYQVITRFSPTCSVTIGKVEVKGPEEISATVTPLTKSIGQLNGGSASISNVEGGVKPYTYQLDSGSFTTATELSNLSGGIHTLVVKDANGCTSEITFTIEAITEIEIPNGFTPNGDGLNDKWAIKNLALLYPNCRITVFNRWGSPVFESSGYSREWDGTINGKRLPDGTYYCIIELGDGQAPMKKSVTIMR